MIETSMIIGRESAFFFPYGHVSSTFELCRQKNFSHHPFSSFVRSFLPRPGVHLLTFRSENEITFDALPPGTALLERIDTKP